MCDFSGNLIAWLDGELPPEEAERARQHLEACSECRLSLESYRRVALEFNAFCDEQLASATPRATPRWIAATAAAGAIAAVLALLLIASERRAVQHPSSQPQGTRLSVSAVDVAKPAPLHARKVEKSHRAAAPHQVHNESSPWPSVASVAKDSSASRTAKSLTTEGTESHRENRPALNAYAPPYEPVIEISIPADEMFPPGAVPPGMGFAADLAIAADGSPDRLRLQPRLVGFERRTSVP
jgi:hypothetical protein